MFQQRGWRYDPNAATSVNGWTLNIGEPSGAEPSVLQMTYNSRLLLSGGSQQVGGINGVLQGEGEFPESHHGKQADFDSLIDLITTTIAPSSWTDSGGSGSIAPFETNLTLVVSQSQQVHEQRLDYALNSGDSEVHDPVGRPDYIVAKPVYDLPIVQQYQFAGPRGGRSVVIRYGGGCTTV